MELETLGNIGDFLGGLGVLVTVIYLAYQVRQNTLSSRRATYQAVVASISEWSREICADRDLARLVRTGMIDLDALDDDELSQFELLLTSFVRNLEKIHYQHSTGAIPDANWAGWSERTLALMTQPGVRQWWARHAPVYSTDFRDWVGEALNDSGPRSSPVTLPEERTGARN